jgi:hypothetical protein
VRVLPTGGHCDQAKRAGTAKRTSEVPATSMMGNELRSRVRSIASGIKSDVALTIATKKAVVKWGVAAAPHICHQFVIFGSISTIVLLFYAALKPYNQHRS